MILRKITPLDVRDKLVECFIDTNKRLVKERAKKQGKKISDEEIERQLTADVKRVFKLVKEDFSRPRKESFPKVIALLRHRCKSSALAKKDEQEIMKNIHKMMNLVKRLKE